MNLLVTNPRSAQAYAIIRALRPHARKIVVTMYGTSQPDSPMPPILDW